KYKFSDRLCAGTIANFSTNRLKSDLSDMTIENDVTFNSYNRSPLRPNDALTLTVFTDWQLDDKGKMLSLTYNFFNHNSKSFSEVTTVCPGNESRLTNEGNNKYRIHSAKLDAILPFNSFKLETGLAFTGIGNNTRLSVSQFDGGLWANDPLQSNRFNYDENTAAAYVSMERNFTDAFFGKLGLRYEHTDVKGHQDMGNERHNNSYGYLFPSLNLSYNS
ncbi:MAG: TonB-dependent receptor, partial [Muribaculaceae bacterium]|nr:TonB-dependent receptor [Muribaculaceae bacterium]